MSEQSEPVVVSSKTKDEILESFRASITPIGRQPPFECPVEEVKVPLRWLAIATAELSARPASETGAGCLTDVLIVAQGGLLTSDEETWRLALETVQNAIGGENWAKDAVFPARAQSAGDHRKSLGALKTARPFVPPSESEDLEIKLRAIRERIDQFLAKHAPKASVSRTTEQDRILNANLDQVELPAHFKGDDTRPCENCGQYFSGHETNLDCPSSKASEPRDLGEQLEQFFEDTK